jgi:serine/threonine protein kinase
VQEFCNGGSLRGALGKGLFGADHLPSRWDGLMSVLRDVAAGMSYMHAKRICHGDLNPSNILLKVSPPPSPLPFNLPESIPFLLASACHSTTFIVQ